MSTQLPDWYRGWASNVLRLRATEDFDIAFERSNFLTGYLSALFMADLISVSERNRMRAVEQNAIDFAMKTFIPLCKKEA